MPLYAFYLMNGVPITTGWAGPLAQLRHYQHQMATMGKHRQVAPRVAYVVYPFREVCAKAKAVM